MSALFAAIARVAEPLAEPLADLIVALVTAPNPRAEIAAARKELETRTLHRANQVALNVVKP